MAAFSTWSTVIPATTIVSAFHASHSFLRHTPRIPTARHLRPQSSTGPLHHSHAPQPNTSRKHLPHHKSTHHSPHSPINQAFQHHAIFIHGCLLVRHTIATNHSPTHHRNTVLEPSLSHMSTRHSPQSPTIEASHSCLKSHFFEKKSPPTKSFCVLLFGDRKAEEDRSPLFLAKPFCFLA